MLNIDHSIKSLQVFRKNGYLQIIKITLVKVFLFIRIDFHFFKRFKVSHSNTFSDI